MQSDDFHVRLDDLLGRFGPRLLALYIVALQQLRTTNLFE